jgi:hypothetical protein
MGIHGGPSAALSWKAGARATGTRGALGAALSWEAGTRAAGTCGGPRAALPFVLTWSLYAGVPGLLSYPVLRKRERSLHTCA